MADEEVKETPEAPVEEKPGETPEEASPQEEKGSTVPITRFNEVYRRQKELETEISSLKSDKAKGNLTPEQEKELQAKTYLKGLLKETLEEDKKAQKAEETQQQEKFETEVGDVLGVNPDVKKDDFLKFLTEEGDDFSSIASAMKQFRKVNNLSKEVSEEAKRKALKKPGLPKSEGEGAATPPDDRNKSLQQIAKEEIEKAKVK